MKVPFDPLELLPHRPPIAMLTSIDSCEDETLRCRAQVDPKSSFVVGGQVPGVIAIEMAAQACAAFDTLSRSAREGTPQARRGYLVGAKGVECVARFAAGESLRVEVEREASAPPLALFRFVIHRIDGTPIARGTLSAFIDAPSGA
jgi:predicted hotdog family 3-hydroxylacyl-ACP dehydratase